MFRFVSKFNRRNYGLNTIIPEQSIRVHKIDQPWISAQFKDLIARRQKALASGNTILFKVFGNRVNQKRKRCCNTYYANKVAHLLDARPRDWWREVKQLSGTAKTTGRDLTSMLHQDLICEEPVLAEKINQAFMNIMKDYQPLTDSVRTTSEGDQPITVTETSVGKKLRAISTSRTSGPDDLPNWVLKEYSDILAVPITDILNTSFAECRVPRAWKIADVPPRHC